MYFEGTELKRIALIIKIRSLMRPLTILVIDNVSKWNTFLRSNAQYICQDFLDHYKPEVLRWRKLRLLLIVSQIGIPYLYIFYIIKNIENI